MTGGVSKLDLPEVRTAALETIQLYYNEQLYSLYNRVSSIDAELLAINTTVAHCLNLNKTKICKFTD